MRNHRFVVLLAFVVGVAAGAGATIWAQTTRVEATPTAGPGLAVTTDTAGHILRFASTQSKTLPNEALALRVVGKRHGRLVGTLVAKDGNDWVEVQLAPQDVLASR